MTVIVNRIFYIDVGDLSPTDALKYIDNCRKNIEDGSEKTVAFGLKRLGLWEDFYIPVRFGDTQKLGILEKMRNFVLGVPKELRRGTRIEILSVEVGNKK